MVVAANAADQERRQEIGRQRRMRTRARIVAAAFDLFGGENGLFVRVEDIASAAGITRQTFYDHFTGMAELREAVTFEVTHDFLLSVSQAVLTLDDPRERAAAAIRFYLGRTRQDARWGWSMINLSNNGIIFGAETHRQAQRTVQEGIDAGRLGVVNSVVGRDLVLGMALAAMATMLREQPGDDFATQVVEATLTGLGVDAADAAILARRPLPPLAPARQAGVSAD